MSTAGQNVDTLLKLYADKSAEKAAVTKEVDLLIEQINMLAGDADKESGTIYLEGETLKAKITRRLNTRITDKDKLSELLGKFQKILAPLFSIQFKESAGKVDKFLVSPPEDQKEVAKALEAIYEKTPGKPSIEVVLK